MSLTRAEVIEYLEGLGATELGELVDELQRRIGVTPAPPMPIGMGAAPVRVVMGESLERDETVRLLGWVPGRKLDVIRAVRADLKLPLFDAKRLVESAPVDYQTYGDWRGRAPEALRLLRAAGAWAVRSDSHYFEVVLLGVDEGRAVDVAGALRERLGIAVGDVRSMLAATPAVCDLCDTMLAAEDVARVLRGCGAQVEVRTTWSPRR